VARPNAACRPAITPPLQIPDEPNHFAYTTLLAEGRLPSPDRTETSPAIHDIMHNLDSYKIRCALQQRSLANAAKQRTLERDIAAPHSREAARRSGSGEL